MEHVIRDQVISQLLALIAFFAFPIVQYGFLKFLARNKGQPGLWFLPKYGFRLVIRNIPSRRFLKDIKYRVYVREVVPAFCNTCNRSVPSAERKDHYKAGHEWGCDVETFIDTDLRMGEELFVFPGVDQWLLSFRLQNVKANPNEAERLTLIVTDKLGEELNRMTISDNQLLRCEYAATVQNLFNFDIRMAKRAEITSSSLQKIMTDVKTRNKEQRFSFDSVENAG